MKGRPVDQLVFEYMFPKPRQSDPQNFHALLQRHLILEVRQEVHSFYGHLETQEAKYPGLDYCHPTHRIRLSRWQWHRRLFRAFDGLRLTPNEISSLTKWEGTRWAKERYEREQGITIRDTTADEFADWADPQNRAAARASSSTPSSAVEATPPPAAPAVADDENMAEDDESDEEELESVGADLNMRLRERVALRNTSGDTSMPLDEEWEQWLKQAIETGELPSVAEQIGLLSGGPGGVGGGLSAEDFFPPRMVSAARRGDWHEIPDFLHDMMRQTLNGERRSGAVGRGDQNAVPSSSASSLSVSIATSSPLGSLRTGAPEQHRRTHSGLRLPDPRTPIVDLGSISTRAAVLHPYNPQTSV